MFWLYIKFIQTRNKIFQTIYGIKINWKLKHSNISILSKDYKTLTEWEKATRKSKKSEVLQCYE